MRLKGNNVFVSFLELLNVKHIRKYADKHFNEHPHKYNLFGISQMLSDYGIENAGVKIADKGKDIFDIECPFIAHFGQDFVAVHKMDENKVHFIRNGNNVSVPIAEFVPAWSGIVLLAEPGKNPGEPDYKENKKKEWGDRIQRKGLIFAVALLLSAVYWRNALFANSGLTLLLLIHLAGVYIAYGLVLKQLNFQSNYADKICSLFSKSDCNNVLESKAAKLWGIFGWSEIGLGYFAANVLILLFMPDWVSYLAVINLFTLPYSFWSVGYQKFKAKQWCPLCLIVQVLLWTIIALNCWFGYIQLPVFNWINLIGLGMIACIYGIGIVGITIAVRELSKSLLVGYLKQEINSIKANENVFQALLRHQPYFETTKSDSQLLFGNPDARLRVTIFTNPYCNPCAYMHKRVEKLLNDTNNTVCVQYILSSFDKEFDFANKHLIAAYLEKGADAALSIFNAWFEKGKAQKEAFFNELSLNMDNPAIESEFQKHESWKTQTQLRATPTILVNGYQLPENYKMEDLRYFTTLEIGINESLPKSR
jgi:protein-disulfide isomerase